MITMELHPKYSPDPELKAVTYSYNFIIELKSSKFKVLNLQSTVSSKYSVLVLPNFIPDFENLEIFLPAASLIFKNIHQCNVET